MNTLSNLEKGQPYEKPAIEIVKIELEGQILAYSEILMEDEGDEWS